MGNSRIRRIGFSTGALARDDVRRAVELSLQAGLDAIELSALRLHQLEPLVAAIDGLEDDVALFDWVSFHIPSRFEPTDEERVLELLAVPCERGWPLVVHPDVLYTPAAWRRFGRDLLVENMDERKAVGQTADDLAAVFRRIPEARFCCDLAHARQVDPTLGEAERLLLTLGPRLAELHVSHVTPDSAHHRLTADAVEAFGEVAGLVPDGVPVIVESPMGVGGGVTVAGMEEEVGMVRRALGLP